MKKMILGSTSVYRQQLLKKLGLAFTTAKPDYDEDKAKTLALKESRSPREIAEILSKGKGRSLWSLQSDKDNVLIISGDQLVQFEGEIIGKSKNFENAKLQLQKLNGKSHELITAVTIITSEKVRHINHITLLKMKKLSNTEIENYLKLDEPYDCAGSYKIEQHGITLFEKIDCDDFTAIQGLPLIWITNQMKELGYEFFKK